MNMNYWLKSAIFESGMSQFLIAAKANIHPTRLSQLIHGWTQPRPDEKERIAAILGRPEDELFVTRVAQDV